MLMNDLVLYTSAEVEEHAEKIRDYLNNMDIAFEERNVSTNEDHWNYITERFNENAVRELPILLIQGKEYWFRADTKKCVDAIQRYHSSRSLSAGLNIDNHVDESMLSAEDGKGAEEVMTLNASVIWPPTAKREKASSVIWELSNQMDEICGDDSRDYNRFSTSFQRLESNVCRLQQVTRIPTSRKPEKYVAFVLNLYNLLVRHAVIACQHHGIAFKTSRLTIWPSDHQELDAILTRIGYNIGGTLVTAAHLQDILIERRIGSIPETPRDVWYERRERVLLVVGCVIEFIEKKFNSEKSEAYSFHKPDPRTAFALVATSAMGAKSNALETMRQPFTVDPNRLNHCLTAMAQQFCRPRVEVHLQNENSGNACVCTVVLPTFLEAWYSFNFCTEAIQNIHILEKVKVYLDENQKKAILNAQSTGEVRVMLDNAPNTNTNEPEGKSKPHGLVGKPKSTQQPSVGRDEVLKPPPRQHGERPERNELSFETGSLSPSETVSEITMPWDLKSEFNRSVKNMLERQPASLLHDTSSTTSSVFLDE